MLQILIPHMVTISAAYTSLLQLQGAFRLHHLSRRPPLRTWLISSSSPLVVQMTKRRPVASPLDDVSREIIFLALASVRRRVLARRLREQGALDRLHQVQPEYRRIARFAPPPLRTHRDREATVKRFISLLLCIFCGNPRKYILRANVQVSHFASLLKRVVTHRAHDICTAIPVRCTPPTDQIEEQRKRCAAYSQKALVFSITTFLAYMGSSSSSTTTTTRHTSFKIAMAAFFLAGSTDFISVKRTPKWGNLLTYLSCFLLVLLSCLLLVSFNKTYTYALLPVPLPIVISLLRARQLVRSSKIKADDHGLHADIEAAQHTNTGDEHEATTNQALDTNTEADPHLNGDDKADQDVITEDDEAPYALLPVPLLAAISLQARQQLSRKIKADDQGLHTDIEAAQHTNTSDEHEATTNQALSTNTEADPHLNGDDKADQDVITEEDQAPYALLPMPLLTVISLLGARQLRSRKINADDHGLHADIEAARYTNTGDEDEATTYQALPTNTEANGDDEADQQDVNTEDDQASHPLITKNEADDEDLDGIFNVSALIVTCGGLINIGMGVGHYVVGPNKDIAVSPVGFLFFFTVVLGLYLMMVTTVRNAALTLHVSQLAYLLQALLLGTLGAIAIWGIPRSAND